ncbi:hypothetical protein L3V77_02460 [Vibrio sp. DW001]|uniref:hypothetical protein n=1 Tax=Vibrio sp. DW001 TaxID=2912315 RepID=UPI0023AF0876|nr:hypothetical protein [Vibrio sp. DW001]WED27122.1 hypothetical protein L3V77_02460 [Vibrio sp. DW001]
MKELNSSEAVCINGGNKTLVNIGRKVITKAAKEYYKDPDKVAERAKTNWGTKKKAEHYKKRVAEAKERNNRSKESRVICTHFYQRGMLDHDIWRADLEFTQKNLSQTTVRGYHYWAIPYVKLMRKNSTFEKIMYPIAKYRAIELAYQMGVTQRGSITGKIIRLIFEPSCYIIGTFCTQKDWSRLWEVN